MFEHKPQPPHSVLCMMADIFDCPDTAQLLYTNDEKVVCDIILRQITDLAPDDQVILIYFLLRREYVNVFFQ